MTKIIYSYDPITGVFAGEGVADASPLEADVYLIPAHATEVPPPAVEARQAAVFAAGAWTIQPDLRAVPLYSTVTGEPITVHEIGPQPADSTDLQRPSADHRWTGTAWALDLAAARARGWNAIKTERDRRADAGGYLVAGKWFHSDQKSRSQQLGLVLLGANIPAGWQWKTMDGSFIAMTPALAQLILGAAAASDVAIFTAAETHRAALEASAEPAAYDFSGGWPAGFGE